MGLWGGFTNHLNNPCLSDYTWQHWGYFCTSSCFVICYRCTPTGSDSLCNITHFINFFVYRSPDGLQVCGGLISESAGLCGTLSALNHVVVIFPRFSVCLFASLVSCRATVMTVNKASALFVIPRSFSLLNRRSVEVQMSGELKRLHTQPFTFFHSYLLTASQFLWRNANIFCICVS